MFLSQGNKLLVYLSEEDIEQIKEKGELEKYFVKIKLFKQNKPELCPGCGGELYLNHEIDYSITSGDARIYYDECMECGYKKYID